MNSLKPESVLPQDLYSSYGVKLLSRGTKLTATVLGHLKTIDETFFLADNARAFARITGLREIDPARLERGERSLENVVSLGGRVPGDNVEIIEPHHLDAFSHGAFEQLNPEPQRIAAERRRLASAIVAQHRDAWEDVDFNIPGDDVPLHLDFSHDQQPDWLVATELIGWRDERVEILRTVYTQLLAGLPIDIAPLERIVDEMIGLLRRAPMCYAQIALLGPRAYDYLPDHAMSTSVLAVGLAARLQWPVPDIRLAGLAGLLHDTGMMLLPQRIRVSSEGLSEEDQSRIMEHSGYSISLLEGVEAVPESIRCAIYRHHERDNGQGYPNGLKAAQIGNLGRLLGLVDIAAAMNEPRPFRHLPLPHQVVQTMVQFGVDGLIDRQMVRSLIEMTGIYPIGSYVSLSTGKTAQVIGLYPSYADRPVVRECDGLGRPTGAVLDLTGIEPWEVSVLDGVPDTGEEHHHRAG